MLFLLNDQVMRLDRTQLPPPLALPRLQRLSFDFICGLGRELFAEQPMLLQTARQRAERLAALISAKQPQINAALFVAPGFGCPPETVTTQFAEVSFEAMAWLYQQQKAGRLSRVIADRQVWRRLDA